MPPKKTRKRAAKAPNIDTTQKTLVIVESPAKAKTIKKYLGSGFEVTASMGHVADLAKGNGAIDKENDFAPTYVVSPEKKKVVSALKKAAKAMDNVWLATDEDREGEAIAWHLCRELGLDVATTPRIVFREITKSAIDHAKEHLRTIDMDLVNAQQARRVLDRLVWFELSPILWRKVKTGLSAGRVQSVAVRLLVEKEREIQEHELSSSFKVTGTFATSDKETLDAELNTKIATKEAVHSLFEKLAQAEFIISDIEQRPWTKNPAPPLTTSGLQQAASSKLGFSVQRTMQLAQRLYEAGHITYMRTDSLSLSGQAIGAAKEYITKEFGSQYSKTRQFKTKSKGAQQAHECIRPTNFTKATAWTDDAQKKLYRLIWQRTLASQMAPAAVQRTTITIQPSTTKEYFKATGEVVTFEGFLKIYDNKKDADEWLLPMVQQGDVLTRSGIEAQELYSKPPARYSEASLVKKLEELGIGRPSTYAPTIATIQKRGYVETGINEWTPTKHAIVTLLKWGTIKESVQSKNILSNKGRLVPTDVGMVVTDFLVEHFPKVLDYGFTARVEEQFDEIADEGLNWHTMIKEFYGPFHHTVEEVSETAERASGERTLGKDPKSGKSVLVRIGRYGPLVQIGEQDDEEKIFASLPHGMHIATVTLEQALTAFALPRVLGERNDKPIKASIGRFGPYVQRWSTFASLKAPDDPYEVEYDRALELIKEKIKKDKERILKEFTYDGKEWTVMKGRRWPFIKWNRKSVKLPKGTDSNKMTQKDIEQILEKEVKTKKKSPTKKKPATKKK